MASQSRIKSPVELQKYLKGVDYPASKEDLVAASERNGAPREVVDLLQRLPSDRFESPVGVQQAFGELTS